MPKLVLVDAHNYLHRAFHALPVTMTTSRGEPVNAVFGFTKMLLKILKEQRPDFLAVCFDAPGPSFRSNLYADYKATRKETDANLVSQFPLSREIVQAMGLASFELEGFEADDLIATLAVRAESEGVETLIVSGDKDILQLVGGKTLVLNEGSNQLFDAAEVEKKWGVPPERVADLLSLMGDTSDNIPGVPGVGPKTAVKLIQDFGSLDGVLKELARVPEKVRQKIEQNRELLDKSRELVKLETRVPVEIDWDELRIKLKDAEGLMPLLRRLEFHSLVNELYSKGVVSPAAPPAQPASGDYRVVLTPDDLNEVVRQLRASDPIAVDVETTGLNLNKLELVGISVSWKKEQAAYIPLAHRYLGAPEQLPPAAVFAALKPVLEDPQKKVVGQNLKFDFSVLLKHGIRIRNLHFDTMLGSYCLDPARRNGLKELAPEFLGRQMTHIEELFAASAVRHTKDEFPMDQLEIEKVAPYACADADCTLQLMEPLTAKMKERQTESLFWNVEMPLVEILADMEMAGVRMDIDYLEQLGKDFSVQIGEIEKQAYALAGQEFNLASSKQIAFVLFEKLQLPAGRKTKTGYSTDEEVLRQLSAAHELPAVLLRHRELSKLRSTYIDGLLSEVDPKTGRVHTSFNQAGTTTGRLSSSDPNLQNIPIRSEHGRRIRRAFIPAEGTIFVAGDYSQIDLRVLAHLSGDPVLCRAFQEDADIHRATAAEVFRVAPADVTNEQRSRAKAINFGIVYGQQAFGLSQTLGISMAEAQGMIDSYFQRYSRVKEWIEETKQQARNNGSVRTLLGRVRYLPEMTSKNGAMRAFGERLAINTPVQGTSADIIKAAMIRIAKNPAITRHARMLLQVHDDLLFECPEKEAAACAAQIRKDMEEAVNLSVPVRVDMKRGKNWADMEPLREKAPAGK